MAIRPDLVECWVFRLDGRGAAEYLLIRRATDRIFAGLWQCVTGRLEPDERAPLAALREVAEEVGFGAATIEAAYDLDQATLFYDEGADGLLSAAIFAVRVAPTAEPVLSPEHDAHRWAARAGAERLAIWPTYRESMRRIEERLLDPATAAWFEIGLDGRRRAR
jgi:8-oxo-dGTP pyrophosphatase MutT (NUDIX family)